MSYDENRYDQVASRVKGLLGKESFSRLSDEEVCSIGGSEFKNWRDLSYKECVNIAIDRLQLLSLKRKELKEFYLNNGKNIYINVTDHFQFRVVERFATPKVNLFDRFIKRAYEYALSSKNNGEIKFFDRDNNLTIVLEKQGSSWISLVTTYPGDRDPVAGKERKSLSRQKPKKKKKKKSKES